MKILTHYGRIVEAMAELTKLQQELTVARQNLLSHQSRNSEFKPEVPIEKARAKVEALQAEIDRLELRIAELKHRNHTTIY